MNVFFPNVEKLIALANFFHVTVDYLLGRTRSNLPPDVFEQSVLEDMTVGDLIQALQQLPNDRKNAVCMTIMDREKKRKTLSFDAYHDIQLELIEIILLFDLEKLNIRSEGALVNYISNSVYHAYRKILSKRVKQPFPCEYRRFNCVPIGKNCTNRSIHTAATTYISERSTDK